MQKFKVPKGYKLNVQCCKEENGPVTHLIFSKNVGENLRYFLYKVLKDNAIEQVSTSQTPTKLYQMIWP